MRKVVGSVLMMAMLVLANQSIQNVSAQAKKSPAGLTVEVYKDNAGEFRFRIKEGDTILASSGKGYETKDEVTKVINNLKSHMSSAKIVDETKDAPKGKDKDKKKG